MLFFNIKFNFAVASNLLGSYDSKLIFHVYILFNAYNTVLNIKNLYLINETLINWNNYKKLISFLAKNEKKNLQNEHKIRNIWERRIYKRESLEDKLFKLNNIPTKKRKLEKFIDPNSQYWETRYYNGLFKMDITTNFIKRLCINYMEGLEWNFKYK